MICLIDILSIFLIFFIRYCPEYHFLSHIYHTFKDNFSRHTNKAVFKTYYLIVITFENSGLIFLIRLFPTLNLTINCFANFQFKIIEVFNNLTLIDEPAKSVRALAVRIMKMIPDVVGVVVLYSSVSVSALKCVTVIVLVSSLQIDIFFFFCGLYTVCSLLYLLIVRYLHNEIMCQIWLLIIGYYLYGSRPLTISPSLQDPHDSQP